MIENPVTIIGGGPTGTLTSIHLSLKGIEHTLLEASSFPRDKACADILTSKAIREIQMVGHGLWDRVKSLPSYKEIWGTRLRIERKDFIDIPYKPLNSLGHEPSCVAVKRIELDALLWRHASSYAECQPYENHRVTSYSKEDYGFRVLTKARELKSKFLILAHGCQSLLGNSCLENQSTSNHIAIGVRAYYQNVGMEEINRCELFLQRKTMPGGFYIAPLGDGSCNVNIVIRKDALKRKRFNITSLLTEFTSSNSELKERFAEAYLESKVIGHSLSLGTMNRNRFHDGVFLAGDAGGLIDLISANGIPQGLLSSRLVSVAMGNILSGKMTTDEAGRTYDEELRRLTASDLKIGRSLSPLMSYDWFNKVLLSSMQRIQNSTQSNLLQDLLYSEDPWQLIKTKMNPLVRIKS